MTALRLLSGESAAHVSEESKSSALPHIHTHNDALGDDAEAMVLERLATTGPGKQYADFPEDALRFMSRFDGGNMQSVTRIAADVYHVEVAEDASAFGISTGYTTWFYFEIHALDATKTQSGNVAGVGREIQIVLTNMNGQKGLYSNGYTVMHCAVDGSVARATSEDTERVFDNEKLWRRLQSPLSFERYSLPVPALSPATDAIEQSQEADDKQKPVVQRTKPEMKMKMTFMHRFTFANERVRFAFCYPYSYSKLQRRLAALDLKYAFVSASAAEQPQPQKSERRNSATPAPIYYHRGLLARSIEGLRVDLLTISSMDGITPSQAQPTSSSHDPTSTSEGQQQQPQSCERAFTFDVRKKKTVFISARVHSGETPANFMLDGMLDLLLHPTDEGAISLRRNFVFKIIPMLNPDGVCQGFYRTDTRGVNLNRVYEDPSSEHAPTVFAAKQLLLDIVESYEGAGSERALENVVYLDLHAHASRRGCFVYGNNLLDRVNVSNAKQIDTQLFARLVGLNTPYFDYLACSFDKENMSRHDLRDNSNATTSREGSGRVALYKATGLTYVYTIECNYNEGRRNLRHSSILSPPSSSSSSASSSGPVSTPGIRRSPSQSSISQAAAAASSSLARHVAPSSGTRLYMKYSPAEWIDVGIGSLIALLDLFQLSGRSKRVQESPFRSLDGIRKSIWSELKAAELGAAGNSNCSSSGSSSGRETKSKTKDAPTTTTALSRRPSSKM